MPEPVPSAPLLQALADLSRWMSSAGIRGAVVGGIAASLRGRPRATRGVDVLVQVEDAEWQHLLDTAAGFGFEARVAAPLGFAKDTRVLPFRHSASMVDVDVILGALPFEHEVVSRATPLQAGTIVLPVAAAEDLVIMKALAGRPRDIADIESLIDANPNLDLDRVRRHVAEFAALLEMPDMERTLEAILSRALR